MYLHLKYWTKFNVERILKQQGSNKLCSFFFFFSRTLQTCHDDASKFVHLLAKPGCNYLEQDDFIPFLQVRTAAYPGRGLELAGRRGKIATVAQTEWTALLSRFYVWHKTNLGNVISLQYNDEA